MNRIHSVTDYVSNYREVNQYAIVSVMSTSTFRIALGAVGLLYYMRVNTRLLRFFKRQARRQQIWSQKKDLYDESIENSAFMCSMYHRHNTYYGVINKLGMDANGNSQWAWHIYPMNESTHSKGPLAKSIDGSGHNSNSGPLVCKLACIKHIESKGYTIQYMSEYRW